MAKIIFPGVVMVGTTFQWYINDAPYGTTWTATFYKAGAQDSSASGSIGAGGAAIISTAAPATVGTAWEVAISCSDGSYLRVPFQALSEWTFVWQPDYSAALAKLPSIRKAQFGDGYTQRGPSGLNFNPESWDLNFSNITTGEANQIMLFLDSMGGYRSFTWKNPNGFKLRYTCEDYGNTSNDIDDHSVHAKFVQAFM